MNKEEFIKALEEAGFKRVLSTSVAFGMEFARWKHPSGVDTCPAVYDTIPPVNGITAHSTMFAVLMDEVFAKTLERAGMVFTREELWGIKRVIDEHRQK